MRLATGCTGLASRIPHRCVAAAGKQSQCPKQFAHAPEENEIFYGAIPANSPRWAQRLLFRCRHWIEATQSYDKNQLGLADVFLNSLQLCWTACLLTDTVALLRASAFALHPSSKNPLLEMLPQQIPLDL